MLTPRFASTAFLLLVLAACGDETAQTPPAPSEPDLASPPSDAVPQVPVAITLGTVEGIVSDLAAIEAHPLGFEGRVLAANGAEGIQMIRVDGQYLGALNAGSQDEAAQSILIASTYGAARQGSVLHTSADMGNGRTRIVLRSLRADEIEPLRVWTVDAPVHDLCATQGQGIVVTTEGRVGKFTVTTEELAADDAVAFLPDVEGATQCRATRSALWVQHDGGATNVLSTQTEGDQPVLTDAGGLAETEGGFVSVTIYAGALELDGRPVRVVDDQGLVVLPSKLLIEGGNFGGILRDGMVVVLAEDAKLHLVAWSELANAVGVPRTMLSRRNDSADGPSELAVEETWDALRPRPSLPASPDPALPEPPALPER